MALYLNLAQRLIDDIQAQRLPEGSRLPALRTLAKQQAVSMTTATKAYDYLQESGWIYSRPQSGYFVSNRAQIVEFPTLSNQTLERRDPRRNAPQLGYNRPSEGFAPLGIAVLSPELLPAVPLQRTLKRVTQRNAQSLLQYSDFSGTTSVRNAIAQHFRDQHFPVHAYDLIVTHCCMSAVRLAVETLTQPGDTLAVSSPCFNGLLDLLSTLSRNIIEIPLTHQGLDLDALETCMKEGRIRAALLSTNHINPLGITLPNEQKQALAELANQYQIPIIEDDIYQDLGFQKHNPMPAKYWDKHGWILWCSSISKTLSPGMRLGWCLPGRFYQQCAEFHGRTNLGTSTLIQACVAEFFATGDYRQHLQTLRPKLQQQLGQYQQFLQQQLPSEARCSQPGGGLVLWLHVPGLDTDALQREALKDGIDIRSGRCFTTHNSYQDCLRINAGWALFDADQQPTQTHQQLTQLCELIRHKVAPKTDTG
ncbi:PLP-dependent aminotransferase family protein [Saccharospirillum mangrovi]|uniref:aminotransferase-like domain-containing protein n=1 Tax=Saccharospirillum mangrovi TaxID=2161747 RepID=UPI000D3A6591|nr:PLP-dependent aminotransferase family protein [Saccharospirillum mangrovi]